MSDTSVSSPYFQPLSTTNGAGSPSSSTSSSPYPPVNYYNGSGGYDVSTSSYNTSHNNNPVHNPYQPAPGPSKSMTIGAILIWTLVIVGGMYGYYEYSHLPKLHEKHNEHIHEIMKQASQKATPTADISKLKKELENERIRYSKVKQEYDLEHTNALDWKDRSIKLERSLSDIQQYIQESSRQKLLLK
jgi:hypothetical protein